MPKLYTYVVRHDFGFAPNPYHGYCTLACCKPLIRKTAKVGDWILGGGAVTKGRGAQVVFVMQVSETLTRMEYWDDPRFEAKKPRINGSYEEWVGDNIYYDDAGDWGQLPSLHSETVHGKTGCSSCEDDMCDDMCKDLQVDRVLIGEHFVYWGADGPLKPHFPTQPLYFGIGHKFRYKPQLVTEFLDWVESLNKWGRLADPADMDMAERHRELILRSSAPVAVAAA